MPAIEIDGQHVTTEDGINVIQAAARLGIEIPHYCYHPGLSIAGNCRMCLVEIEKMPKLQIACNTRVSEGMIVRTKSERVRKAQEAVLEFLLINHPIDCPVCDQAGECKLQDYYMDYDRQPSRVQPEAKVKKGKAIDIGRLVMLDQERCILCTRCTRFLDEITKTSELGIFERGDHCVIDLFPGKRLDNPYSANVVDICPVGALTNKDFRFRARVWYLDHTPSVCPTCATGCNIDIHHRQGEIFRFRPRRNDAVNSFWMCDEGRVSYKLFQGEDRLLVPCSRTDGDWVEGAWPELTDLAVSRLQQVAREGGPASIVGIVSAQATLEEMFLFQRFVSSGLGGRAVGLSWSPANAYRDEFLIDADRNPNARGLRILGLSTDHRRALENGARDVRAAVLLRADLARCEGMEWFESLRKRLDFLLVLDTHRTETVARADIVLPIGSFAETDGTFVNRTNRVQRIRAAFPPPGRALPGWQVLADLVATAGAGVPPGDAAGIFSEMAASSATLRHLSHEVIGDQGAELPASEAPA
jgi:NADH-quinone oxidoreductase subunit G